MFTKVHKYRKTCNTFKEVEIMYVRPYTTEQEIRKAIEKVNEQLRGYCTKEEREALHTELSYLESFLPVERW